jgi:hypothetical protein
VSTWRGARDRRAAKPRLDGGIPTIDKIVATRDERCIVGEQKADDFRNLFRFAEPTQRVPFVENKIYVANQDALMAFPLLGWPDRDHRRRQSSVPDYLTAVEDGAFYGWPYSYWGQNIDPRVEPQKPDLVSTAIAPDHALGAHVAALGVSFARDGGFGEEFTEGVFIGQHGSWNRQDPSGYKVSWIDFAQGRPAGEMEDFVTGFLTADGEARGRPVGVAFDPAKDILLVVDDLSNTVWRVARSRP